MSSWVSFHSSTWCSNITAAPADLDLQLGDQFAADVVGDPGERLVVNALGDRLGKVHGVGVSFAWMDGENCHKIGGPTGRAKATLRR